MVTRLTGTKSTVVNLSSSSRTTTKRKWKRANILPSRLSAQLVVVISLRRENVRIMPRSLTLQMSLSSKSYLYIEVNRICLTTLSPHIGSHLRSRCSGRSQRNLAHCHSAADILIVLESRSTSLRYARFLAQFDGTDRSRLTANQPGQAGDRAGLSSPLRGERGYDGAICGFF